MVLMALPFLLAEWNTDTYFILHFGILEKQKEEQWKNLIQL